MHLSGRHFVAGNREAASGEIFHACNPRNGQNIGPAYHEATADEIDRALQAAAAAFVVWRKSSIPERIDLLTALLDQLDRHQAELVGQASVESGYDRQRCETEYQRVLRHTRLFMEWLEDGSWLDARIDTAVPENSPPRPDVRSIMQPLGPVVVFGASNFPIAISVLSTDTISALAAGCPVVVKAHPAHPGTSEIAGHILQEAIAARSLPPGLFSLLHGTGHAVGAGLVTHPLTEAVAFTGSLQAGRHLYDLACQRPRPIPFYGELGSINPVFLLPESLQENHATIARDFVLALTQGVGQYCTNPGLVVGCESPAWRSFLQQAGQAAALVPPATMLHRGIRGLYENHVARRLRHPAIQPCGGSLHTPDPSANEVVPTLLETTQEGWMQDPTLSEEIFGPCSTLVTCRDQSEMIALAQQLPGSLTASVHGTDRDFEQYRNLIDLMQTKAGRLIFNGYPVGLEVCHSQHHGGPYPATTSSQHTSVGTRAIQRFLRPVCYQNCPDHLLPPDLTNSNPQGISRLVNGVVEYRI